MVESHDNPDLRSPAELLQKVIGLTCTASGLAAGLGWMGSDARVEQMLAETVTEWKERITVLATMWLFLPPVQQHTNLDEAVAGKFPLGIPVIRRREQSPRAEVRAFEDIIEQAVMFSWLCEGRRAEEIGRPEITLPDVRQQLANAILAFARLWLALDEVGRDPVLEEVLQRMLHPRLQ